MTMRFPGLVIKETETDTLAALEWLREQVINDNNLEFCKTEQERVSLLAMLNRQKQRRKKDGEAGEHVTSTTEKH